MSMLKKRKGKFCYLSPIRMVFYTIIFFYLLTMILGTTLFVQDDQYRLIFIHSWHESIIWTLIFMLLGGLYLMAYAILGLITIIICVLKQVRLRRLIIAVVLAINLPFWLISLWYYSAEPLAFYAIRMTFTEVISIMSYGIFAPILAILLGYYYSNKGRC